MITEFEDFCTWVFEIEDDIWKQISSFFKRPGPVPVYSDSELIAAALIGVCHSWHMENELLSCWKEYRDMFRHISSQSSFNWRWRHLIQAFTLIRQVILRSYNLCIDRQFIIDSLSTPVVQFHLVPASMGDWQAFGVTFGKVPTKKQTIFGYRLHPHITTELLL